MLLFERNDLISLMQSRLPQFLYAQMDGLLDFGVLGPKKDTVVTSSRETNVSLKRSTVKTPMLQLWGLPYIFKQFATR